MTDPLPEARQASPAAAAAPGPVVVLMSTYNGQRWLLPQLESILLQLPPDGLLMVRDDGSRDGSVALVESLGDPRVRLDRGQNLGFGPSFLSLLAMAPPQASLVLLADQDDVWLPGKLERARSWLAAHRDVPALYGGAKRLVDEHLRPLGDSPPWPRPPGFQNALVENIITGCTAALNGPALRLLQRAGVAQGVHFHDWWLYLVVSAHGVVLVDDEPMLLYRQHGHNHIGQGAGVIGRWQQMARFLWRHDWADILLQQVAALVRAYGDTLTPDQLELVHRHFDLQAHGPRASWRLLLGGPCWRQHRAHELPLRWLLWRHRQRKRWRLAAHRETAHG